MLEKILKVKESFIKEAYEKACKDWKQKIDIEFPELNLNIYRKGNILWNEEDKEKNTIILVTETSYDTDSFQGICLLDTKNTKKTVSREWNKNYFNEIAKISLDKLDFSFLPKNFKKQ